MTYTINICPECGAQEQPSPIPGEFAETVHTEECSGPDNVTIEVIPRTEYEQVQDQYFDQKQQRKDWANKYDDLRAVADELAAVAEADPAKYPSSRSLQEARDAALVKYQEATSYGRTASGKLITDELVEELAAKAEAGFEVERPDDDTYGQYNADGTPKRALRRVLDEMENDA